MTKKILILFGTRPELIKLFPLIKQLRNSGLKDRLLVVNTGQHTDLLDAQIEAFQLKTDCTLNISSAKGDLTSLLAKTLEELQNLYNNYSEIEHVIVQGDTNTVLAASNFCFLNKLKLIHIEAGLRSGNMEHPFPEEFNRIVCSLATYHHFAPTNTAKQNLILEGISPEKITVTGNTVIDALQLSGVKSSSQKAKRILVTLHRRENICSAYFKLIHLLNRLEKQYPEYEFIWIAHPNSAEAIALELDETRIHFSPPLPYFEFLELLANSALVITDSGGVTEEAASLGIPTVIYRKCTERIETLECENPTIISIQDDPIENFISKTIDLSGKPTQVYGDGKASERIVEWMIHEYEEECIENFIIGGGIAGTGILLNLMKQGQIDSFLDKGFALIEKTNQLVHGSLPYYHVNSDTLSNVFLECLEGETHRFINTSNLKDQIQYLQKYANKSIPLNLLGPYLEGLGKEIENYLELNPKAQLFKNTEVLSIHKKEDSYSIQMDNGKTLKCKNLIIACGGKPIFNPSKNLNGLQMHSDELLKNKVQLDSTLDLDQNTVLIGGSHSAFSVADFLLKKHPELFHTEDSISIFTHALPKIFYPTSDEALENGYTEFTEEDICPKTQKVFRLAGLRMDGRDLYIRMKGLNGSAIEKRVKIYLINENKALFDQKLKDAHLIIHCTGYAFNLPPFYNGSDQKIHFKGQKDLHWVDENCKLMCANGDILENVYLTGLATGFVPSGELGGENTFNGQTNGLWYYQNATAELILKNIDHESHKMPYKLI